jgi:hypothetical protein
MFFAILVSGSAMGQTLSLDGDEYSPVWSNTDNHLISVEFLRSGETVDDWQQMITAKEFSDVSELKEVLPGYMNRVKPYLALKPEFLHPGASVHKEDVVLVLTLLYPDKSNYEFVIARFYADDGQPVKATIFSHRIKFAPLVSFEEVHNKMSDWIAWAGKTDITVQNYLGQQQPN